MHVSRARRSSRRTRWVAAAAIATVVSAPLLLGSPGGASAAGTAPSCSTAGTWTQGELNVYWLDVEQGDSQFIVGPTGRTMLIDLGESSFNSTGASTHATRIAGVIRSICGIASGPVHLDYVMASHHHLDHIGYAAVPGDTATYGNGIYQLLTPGNLNFDVGTLIDHDGGTWTDSNGNGRCDPGTSTAPSTEIAYHNAGTTSTTGARWICWLYGPAAQADRANINGKVVTLTNTSTWPTIDLGTGVTTSLLEANGKGVMESNGTTPVSGNHTTDATPPSENDYSIGLTVQYGTFRYATAGDSDGEYSTSANGYTYNNIESLLATKVGQVNALRANHHGSSHSSSSTYINAADPQVGVISCGVNSYGHPGNRTLNALRTVGADIYLTNDPCDDVDADGTTPIDYSGTLNHNGDIHLATGSAGATFTVTYDAGNRAYTTRSDTGGTPGGTAADIRVNEFLMAPQAAPGTEWVELVNPTGTSVDISGYYIDDVAAGGGAPKVIPSGTVIPAHGYYVMDIASGFLNNTGSDSVRYLKIVGGVETVYDTYSYNLGSTHYDQVFHRTGDAGAWCGTISSNVTKGAANPTTCP
ncbi:MAG: lamin tail domain-containing protein [Frankiaceae bacterium]